ncbi:Hpt domain-containing protein [Maribellus maritimus]|uniref:Hpt domain-containing protein n=1 Tax=Maribellus maritimus TaxID=2870838 RepID=UPI001EEBF628|nr:Hpt domain-containing protein [Maribellus maritimus]MCG6187014.1 Hpt domain-containing protein [Maribellus maritimus]
MEKENYPLDLGYLDDVAGGDIDFKKELVKIFLQQVPVFIENMKKFQEEKDLENLAKEAHTAKSSVLIFGMEETGANLKKIQLLAEENQTQQIPMLLEKSIRDMEEIILPLQHFMES